MKCDIIEQEAAGGLPPGISELRRFMRRDIRARGWIRHARKRHAVEIRNLSEQGCQLWLAVRNGLPVGDPVTLTIETLGPFDATVRWHREGWTGIEFDRPFYPPVLEHIHDTFDRAAN